MKKATINRHKHSSLIWWLLAILAVPTFLPLLHTGLTNSDAISFLHTVKMFPGIGILPRLGHDYFSFTGRLTHLLTGWCMYFPFAMRSNELFLFFTILPIVLDFLLAIVLVRKYTYNESATQLAALTMLCCFTIHTGFSGTIGHPFWFAFSFLFLLTSLLFLLRYKETQKYWVLLLSALFMLITTTFYETYLVYYVVIYLILRDQYGNLVYRDKTSRRKFIKEIMPFVACGLLFVVTYAVVSRSAPTTYTGMTWAFNPLKTLRSWANIILYSIPGMSFHQYRIPLADLTGDPHFKYDFLYIFTHAGAEAWTKGLLSMAILGGILSSLDLKTTGKRLWFALLLSAMMAILPHLLLCCSQKYTLHIPDSYVTTYFANFGMAFTITVLFLLCRHYLLKWPVVQKAFSLLFAGGLLVVTVLIQYTNDQVMHDVRRANLRYTQVEKFLKKQKIDINGDMPVWTGRFQVSPTLTGKMICSNRDTGIDSYLCLDGIYETNYDVFYERYHESNDYVGIFTCQQGAKSDDLYFIWFRCRGTDLTEDFTQTACDTIAVGYYSAYNSFAVSIMSKQDSCAVLIDGDTLHAHSNAHYDNIRFLNRPALKSFMLTGNRMLPATLSISNILFPGIEPLQFNYLPPHYRKDGIRYFEHELWKKQELKAYLDSTALRQGKNPQEFFKGNAEWLVFYHDQY